MMETWDLPGENPKCMGIAQVGGISAAIAKLAEERRALAEIVEGLNETSPPATGENPSLGIAEAAAALARRADRERHAFLDAQLDELVRDFASVAGTTAMKVTDLMTWSCVQTSDSTGGVWHCYNLKSEALKPLVTALNHRVADLGGQLEAKASAAEMAETARDISGLREEVAEAHRWIHRRLHTSLDALVADYIEHTLRRPSDTTISELVNWSRARTRRGE